MKKLLSLALLVVVPAVFLSGCLKQPETKYTIDLDIWGIFDDSDAFNVPIAEYRDINPYLGSADYRKHTSENYKADLLDAFATGSPPDIFYIQSTWLPEFLDKIEPADPDLLGEAEFRQNFVDVASQDLIVEGKVFGMPLSVDSLSLYYNKDLFNYEAITAPPKTWSEFNDVSQRLVKRDASGQIIQAGASMGTAFNINRSTDIYQALLLQSGIDVGTTGNNIALGRQADQVMEYYTQFARGTSAAYTWNPRMHYSIDAFAEGNLGMMINYSWQYESIKRKNAKLNFAVAPLPQSGNGSMANFPNYWVLVVSKNKFDDASPDPQVKNTIRKHEAWQFLRYLGATQNKQMTLYNGVTGNAKTVSLEVDPTEEYLRVTKKPAARLDLIEKQKSDPVLAPFALGNLLAKSWKQPKNPEEVERIIADAIDGVNIGKYSVEEATRIIETRVNVLYQK